MAARKSPHPNVKPDPLDGLPPIERFKAVARASECDEDVAAFKAKLGQIARYKPKGSEKPTQ
jgi:hypothetical protein